MDMRAGNERFGEARLNQSGLSSRYGLCRAGQCVSDSWLRNHAKGGFNMLNRGHLSAFIMALSVSAVMAAPALCGECLEAKFPDMVKAGDADLQLNGLGIRKATLLAVKVYVAGLYVPQTSSDADK